eukprot:Skav216048  [mRNA]  locus=scaffold2930:320754:324087:+ [translate_table: standard]
MVEEPYRKTGPLSRKVRQREGRRRHFLHEVNHTVSSLNQMYSHDDQRGKGALLRPSAGQLQCVEFIQDAVEKLGAPADVSGPEALEELRVSVGYEAAPTSCPLASYNPDLVALPSGEMNPVPLEQLLGPNGRDEVEKFYQQRMLTPDVAKRMLDESGVQRCYQDPKLNDASAYGKFVKRLLDLNLLDLTLEAPAERVGIFFVRKKNHQMRLILDCRRSNCYFEEPTTTRLATGDAMSKIELEADQGLFVASADLQNAFYTMAMPTQLRKYFGLRAVTAGQLGIENWDGMPIPPSTKLHPRVAVIPMGWKWSLWFCQQVNERLCEKAGLSAATRLRDGQPVPDSNVCHIQYVDNLHVFGTDKEAVQRLFWQAVNGLRDAGLTVHEIEFDEGESKVLGWELGRDGTMRPSLRRVWRIRQAIRELLKRGAASGQQIERIIGHITFVSLCRREVLSIFGECYTFISRHYQQVVPLWKSVRKELSKWDGVSPLIRADLTQGWHHEVCAVDASEWGLGVTVSDFSLDEVRKMGRVCERWRFKDEDAKDPRAYALVEDELGWMGSSIGCDSDRPPKFAGIPFSAVDRVWKMVGRHKWRNLESMPVCEARASLNAVKHALRSKGSFNKRHVVLTDSMTAAVSFDKGRASRYRLRRVVEQVGALTLATQTMFRMRWIPSEWNPSDAISRGKWQPSKPSRFFGDDTPPTRSSSDMAAASKSAASETKAGAVDDGSSHGDSCWGTKRQEPLTWDIDLEEGRSRKKKDRRASRRQQRAAEDPSMTLRKASVSQVTRERYQKVWEELCHFNGAKIPERVDLVALDELVVEFLEMKYHDGEDLSSASYVAASVMFHVPRCKSMHGLGKTAQAMKGWRKLAPPRSRMPLPFEVVCLLAQTAVNKGMQEMGLLLVFMYLLYLRPGEAFRIRVQDIIKPVPRSKKIYQNYNVLLHPTEVGVPSKTYQWDEMLPLDLKHLKFLGPALMKVLDLEKRPKDHKAFRVSITEANDYMKEVWEPLQLKCLGPPHLYRLRHGGASFEAAEQLRSLTEIQVRGRWQTLKSVKNYEKGGRLPQLFASLKPKTRAAGVAARKQLEQLFRVKH